jgi:hypothetical protein
MKATSEGARFELSTVFRLLCSDNVSLNDMTIGYDSNDCRQK